MRLLGGQRFLVSNKLLPNGVNVINIYYGGSRNESRVVYIYVLYMNYE